MYINNVRLHAKHLRRDLALNLGGLPEAARHRLLLQGPNGSGKSTFLETIATLWDLFGKWIDARPGRTSLRAKLWAGVSDIDLAAVEIRDLLPNGTPVWIGVGKATDWVDLKDEHPNSQFAGLIESSGRREIQLPSGDWRTYRHRSLAGVELKPNIVFFPPEHRSISFGSTASPHIIDLVPYRWLATYDADTNLESLLLTVKANCQAGYDDAMQFINQALDNQRKEIVGFGPQGMIVRGKTELGADYEHPIGMLSSGEKQMLLLIGFIAATLRPGGIVIIDDPDLHIHVVMIQELLGSIEAIVKARDGQLIVASHSEDVWNWFSRDSERVELNMWRGVVQ